MFLVSLAFVFLSLYVYDLSIFFLGRSKEEAGSPRGLLEALVFFFDVELCRLLATGIVTPEGLSSFYNDYNYSSVFLHMVGTIYLEFLLSSFSVTVWWGMFFWLIWRRIHE